MFLVDKVAQITTLGLQLVDKRDPRTSIANLMGGNVNRVLNTVKSIYGSDSPSTKWSAAAA